MALKLKRATKIQGYYFAVSGNLNTKIRAFARPISSEPRSQPAVSGFQEKT
jgi:hypothetical protein